MGRERETISVGNPVEHRYQYSSGVAVRRGGFLFISGMVGWNANGDVVAPDDPGRQARQAFENLRDVLAAAGAGFADVVMETEYVVDMDHYRAIGRVRNEFFAAPLSGGYAGRGQAAVPARTAVRDTGDCGVAVTESRKSSF